MDKIPKYPMGLMRLSDLYADTPGISRERSLRKKAISSVVERLRATPDLDYLQVAAWALNELAELKIQLVEAGDENLQLRDMRLADSTALCAAYDEFFDILKSPGLRGYLNVKAKLAKDPKQAVKAEAFKLWQDWQAGRTLHKSGAAFHRYVVEKYPVIIATKTVSNWCKEWTAEVKK